MSFSRKLGEAVSFQFGFGGAVPNIWLNAHHLKNELHHRLELCGIYGSLASHIGRQFIAAPLPHGILNQSLNEAQAR